MQVLRAEWTPTPDESRAFARAAGRVAMRQTLPPLVLGTAGGLLIVSLVLRVHPGVMAGAALVVLAWVVLATARRVASVVRTDYPPGRAATAEASEAGYRITHATAASELPWSRLTDPQVMPTHVSFRDSLARRRFVFPRQLFPEAWLELRGSGAAPPRVGADRVEWTVTAGEQAALIRTSTWRLWRKLALYVVVLFGCGMAVLGSARWGTPGLLLGPAAAMVMGTWLWLSARSSVRRMLLAAYPVGATVAAEATHDTLRLETAVGASDLPWERLTQAVPGPVVVLARDAVNRQWVTLPRQLVPDAWLQHLAP